MLWLLKLSVNAFTLYSDLLYKLAHMGLNNLGSCILDVHDDHPSDTGQNYHPTDNNCIYQS